MNYADFTTAPDGFPLESDATLGFMQTAYSEAVRALAQLAGDDLVVVSGCIESGSVMSDGWILLDGDLVFFEGGTISANFIIQEVATQKANQNGTLVDRYFVKKAVFGSGPSEVPCASLRRWRRDDFAVSTLLNDFTVFSGNSVSLRFLNGVVYCQGVLQNSANNPLPGGGLKAFDLPLWARPAQFKRLAILNGVVAIDGADFVISATGTTFHLDVSWRVY